MRALHERWMAVTPFARLSQDSAQYQIEGAVGRIAGDRKKDRGPEEGRSRTRGESSQVPRRTPFPPPPSWAAQTLRTSGPLSSLKAPVGFGPSRPLQRPAASRRRRRFPLPLRRLRPMPRCQRQPAQANSLPISKPALIARRTPSSGSTRSRASTTSLERATTAIRNMGRICARRTPRPQATARR